MVLDEKDCTLFSTFFAPSGSDWPVSLLIHLSWWTNKDIPPKHRLLSTWLPFSSQIYSVSIMTKLWTSWPVEVWFQTGPEKSSHPALRCTKPSIKWIKVKCITLVQALRLCTGRTAHRGSRGITLFIHNHGTKRGEGSASRPDDSLPPGKTRCPLYRRLGGPQNWSGQVRKIPPPHGDSIPGPSSR
jgi:hypothetical protein